MVLKRFFAFLTAWAFSWPDFWNKADAVLVPWMRGFPPTETCFLISKRNGWGTASSLPIWLLWGGILILSPGGEFLTYWTWGHKDNFNIFAAFPFPCYFRVTNYECMWESCCVSVIPYWEMSLYNVTKEQFLWMAIFHAGINLILPRRGQSLWCYS